MTSERQERDPQAGSVLIIDDHELVGTSLMLSLRSEGMPAHRCGTADGLAGILAAADLLPAGLALLDLDLGRDRAGRSLDGAELVAPLVGQGWRVLILSGSVDQVRIGGALAEGALAWVPKHAPFPALLRSVRAAFEGRDVMEADRRQELVELHRRQTTERRELERRLGRLTQRERAVLEEIAQGHRAQAVADRFVVSLATVRTQIRAILVKLEVGSQLEAVALYRRAIGR
jgi:DNA-binding NarL/FixJ family response regulator